MLKLEEKDRISWEEIFMHPLFEEVSQQQITESLKSMEISYKNDQLVKAKALNKLYFDNNKVITSAFECAKRDKINKIIL
jgi:hypothetical protein